MRIVLFEDSHAEDLNPVALLRPVFELICGRDCLRRRLQRWFPMAEFGVCVRPWLAESYSEAQPEIRVNDRHWIQQGTVLLINGRWLPERRLSPLDLLTHQAGYVDGVAAWLMCEGDDIAGLLDVNEVISSTPFANSARIVPACGQFIRYPWDLINQNSAQLIRDFTDEGVSQSVARDHVQILGDPADVYLSPQASIDPYVVIDTRSGPVSVDRDAQIQSFTRIEGPCHIGRGTQVFRALIRQGTTIGEHCRVGGEIEESILHGFVNKYHEGFLGHSYVCPWVNLGAMSSTSDLKNDYSTVKVPLSGLMVDSELTKIGSFIGDHSKAALDSMFNTGSSVGVMTTVVSGGRLLPRHVPSFSNVLWGEIEAAFDLEKALDVARVVMLRRGEILTASQERLLRTIFHRTYAERSTALKRVTQLKQKSELDRDVTR
jgi:UDP-N-acetylglucosamine diphosphorylase/glucosamine-1-phosphate N-acetyltransferase